VNSEEGKDRGERGDIVRGRAKSLGGEVDVAVEDGDKDVRIPTTGFNRQLAGEVDCW
jgi:hypothetical protein